MESKRPKQVLPMATNEDVTHLLSELLKDGTASQSVRTPSGNGDTNRPMASSGNLEIKPELFLQYLMTDYEAQMQNLQNTGHVVVGRVNILLTIVTALLGAILFVVQNTGLANSTLNLVICAVMSIVLIIGFIVYAEITQWIIITIATHNYIRLIQRYFHQNNPYLRHDSYTPSKYLPFLPKRKSLRDIISINLGQKQIVTVLNNSLAATIATILSITLIGQNIWVFVAGLGAFIVMWILQHKYSRMRYYLAEAENDIKDNKS
jgi:hypothetical protein